MFTIQTKRAFVLMASFDFAEFRYLVHYHFTTLILKLCSKVVNTNKLLYYINTKISIYVVK
jgi:hypothetical protein